MEISDSIAKSDTFTTICQYLFSLQTFQVFPESPNVHRTLLDGPMVDAFGRNLEGFFLSDSIAFRLKPSRFS